MKTLIGVVCMATILFSSPKAHALFGHTAEERRRRVVAEQQLSQEQRQRDIQQQLAVGQQQRVSHWQTTAFVLGITTVIALIVGTAIGSKGRQHAAAGK